MDGFAEEVLANLVEGLDSAGRAERRAMHQARLQEINTEHTKRLIEDERAKREAAERQLQQQLESQAAENAALQAMFRESEEKAEERWEVAKETNRELNRALVERGRSMGHATCLESGDGRDDREAGGSRSANDSGGGRR